MKKKLFSCLVFCSMIVGTQMVDASPANPEVFSFKQPSGETFKAQTKGDERFNYVVTEGGIGLEQGDDGFWYYLQQGNTRNAQIPTTLSKSKVGIDTQPSNAADEQTLLQSKRNERELEIEQKEPAIKVKSSKKKDQNLLVLLVEFEDVKLKYSDEDWSRLIFGETAPSLKNYYSMTTNNGIGIDPARETNGSPNDGIIRLTLDGKHPNTGQQLITENQKITRSALEKADQFIDYKQYDTNGNGRIETDELHFMVIVAGQEQSYGNVTEPAVWGHRWALNSLRVTLDDTVLDYYTQFGEKHAARQATLGIIAHEFGHDIGLPDLYNVGFKDENGVTEKQGSGLGYTSVMASGSWGARPGEESGTTPVGLDAYSKSLLGMAVETITTSQSGKLVQSIDEGTPAILKVNSAEEKEYFLIENRQLSGYDEGMKRGNAIHSGGIAIYRINKNYTQNQTAGKQLVTVLEADESTRGYSYYESGGVWNADPFYYVGNNIHNKEQAIKLSKDTNPSSKIADGFGEFDLTIESKSNRNMTVSFSEPIVPVESISIDSENIEINVRDTKQLMAKIVPENASDKEIKWTSTDDSIVSINQEGKLVGKSSGTVTISAINEKFNVKKEIQVTVKSKLGKTAEEAVEYTFEELTSHNLVESKQFQESGWLKLKVPETGYYDVGGSWGFRAVPDYEGKGTVGAEFFQEHTLNKSAGKTLTANIENGRIGSGSGRDSGLPIYYEKDSYMHVKLNFREISGNCPYIFVLKKSNKAGEPILTADENLSLSSEVGAIPNVSTYYKLNKKYKLNITNKIVPTLAPQYKLETSTPNVVTLTKENDVYYMEFKTYGTFKLTLIEQVSGATKDFTDEVRERTNSPLGKTAGEAVEYTFEELTSHNLVESKQFQESGWLKLKVPETGYYDVGGSWGFRAVPGYEGKGRIKAEFFQEHSLEQSAGNTNLVNIENSGTGSASVTNKGLPIYYEKDSYMYVKFNLKELSGDCPYIFILKKSNKEGGPILTADENLSLSSEVGAIPNVSTYYKLNKKYKLNITNKIVPTLAPQYKLETSTPNVVTLTKENDVYHMEFKTYGTFKLTLIEQVSGATKDFTDEVRERTNSPLGKTAGEAVEYTFEELTSHNLVESKQFQESGWLKLKVPETGYYDVGGSWGFTAVPGYEGKGRIKAEFFQEHSLEQSAGNTNLVNIENSGTGSASVTNKGLPIYYEKDSYMYVKFNLKELSGDCPYIFVLKKSNKAGEPILTADENLSLSSEVGAIPNVSTYYKLNKKYKLNITNKIVPTLAPQYKLETSTPNVVTLTKENDVYYMEFKTYGAFKLTLIEQVSGATKDFTDEVRERTNSPLGKTAGEAVEYTFEELTSHNLVESKQFQESGWLKLKVPETGYYNVGGSWGFTAVPGYEGKGRIKAEFFQEHSLEQSAGNTNLVNIENSGTGSASVTNKGLPIYYEKDSYMYVKFNLKELSGDCPYIFILKKS